MDNQGVVQRHSGHAEPHCRETEHPADETGSEEDRRFPQAHRVLLFFSLERKGVGELGKQPTELSRFLGGKQLTAAPPKHLATAACFVGRRCSDNGPPDLFARACRQFRSWLPARTKRSPRVRSTGDHPSCGAVQPDSRSARLSNWWSRRASSVMTPKVSGMPSIASTPGPGALEPLPVSVTILRLTW